MTDSPTDSRTSSRTSSRTILAAGLLVGEAALAVLGVLVHYGFTAEYGDVTSSTLQAFWWAVTRGVGGLALAIVTGAAIATALVATTTWLRVIALVIPPLVVVGMLAVTPLALQHKLEVQDDAALTFVVDNAPARPR